jgi:hypothetical protein
MNFSLLASLDRNSTVSFGVANPGCERTVGKITGLSKVVNRTLAFFGRFPNFSHWRSCARMHL